MNADSPSMIRVTVGAVSIECQGSEPFVKAQVTELIDRLIDSNMSLAEYASVNDRLSPESTSSIDLSMNSICSKLKVKTGPALVLASCAFLSLVENKGTFARREIIQAMRSANNYFTPTYVSNLSSYLKSLSNKLLENAKGHYALKADALQELRKALED